MEAALSSQAEVVSLHRALLTCAWEAFVSGALLVSVALVKSQLLTLVMLPAGQQRTRGDDGMECYGLVKPMDAQGEDDEGNEDDDPEGDGEFGEGEEDLSSDGGEDYGANPNNNNNGNAKKGGARGGSGGAEESGEDEDDEEQDGQNTEEEEEEEDVGEEEDEDEVVEEEDEDEERVILDDDDDDDDDDVLPNSKKVTKFTYDVNSQLVIGSFSSRDLI